MVGTKPTAQKRQAEVPGDTPTSPKVRKKIKNTQEERSTLVNHTEEHAQLCKAQGEWRVPRIGA